MEPPRAIKLPPNLAAMPLMIRRMIIEDVYRRVTITIEPPDDKSNEERILVLSLAAVNKEFRQEVMAFIFTQGEVEVLCNDVGAILTSPRSTSGFGLCKWITKLKFLVKDCLYFLDPLSGELPMASILFPSIKALHAESVIQNHSATIADYRRADSKKDFAQSLFDGFSRSGDWLNCFLFISQWAPYARARYGKMVLNIKILFQGSVEFNGLFEKRRLTVQDAGFAGERLWKKSMKESFSLHA